MEGTCLNYRTRQKVVFIHPFENVYADTKQPRNAEQTLRQLIGLIIFLTVFVFIDIRHHLFVYLKDGIIRVKVDL